MTLNRLATIVLVFGTQIVAAPRMRVWAVGDSLRINPVTGKAWEDNPLLFSDALTGDYKESNLSWNGGSRRVSLRAARNEIVAFQVIIERDGSEPLNNVNVSATDWTGPNGVRLPKQTTSLFKEWYVNVTKRSAQSFSLGTGWYPDALIPLTKWTGKLFPRSSLMPFSTPDLLNNIGPQQQNQAIWVDVFIPSDRVTAPPGTYSSTLTVSSDSGRWICYSISKSGILHFRKRITFPATSIPIRS